MPKKRLKSKLSQKKLKKKRKVKGRPKNPVKKRQQRSPSQKKTKHGILKKGMKKPSSGYIQAVHRCDFSKEEQAAAEAHLLIKGVARPQVTNCILGLKMRKKHTVVWRGRSDVVAKIMGAKETPIEIRLGAIEKYIKPVLRKIITQKKLKEGQLVAQVQGRRGFTNVTTIQI